MTIMIVLDGATWLAYRKDTFVNLQESVVGWGSTPLDALQALLDEEAHQ